MKLKWFSGVVAGVIGIASLSGCASSKPKTAATYERPWIGGAYKSIGTPKAARQEGRHFARWGVLVTETPPETPVHNGGLQPSDVILAVNGKNVRNPGELGDAINAGGPAQFSIYRDGEFIEKTVNPGVERFKKNHIVTFGLGLSANFSIDLWPNPDFSLIAIGYKQDKKRLDLNSAEGRYRSSLREREENAMVAKGEKGVASDERWKAWTGPISLGENKVVLSQSAVSSK